MTDIRKEQLVLLRFEKQIAGLAATLAGGAAVIEGLDAKLGSATGSEAMASLQSGLMQLAQATADAHAALNAKALEAGVRLLQASGGTPKEDPPSVVASILGLG